MDLCLPASCLSVGRVFYARCVTRQCNDAVYENAFFSMPDGWFGGGLTIGWCTAPAKYVPDDVVVGNRKVGVSSLSEVRHGNMNLV